MRILDITTYKGRNIYSHFPVIKIVLDIGKYANTPTNKINGFNERLIKAFPGLKTNRCGLGYEGGFLEKLQSGTYLAHVIEHMILEMQTMAGYDVSYGKTRMVDEPSKSNIIYEYLNEVCGLECGKAAVYIAGCFIKNANVNIDGILAYIKEVSAESELGPSTASIVSEAKKRGIPVSRFGFESMVHLGYGKYRRTIQATLTDKTSCIAVDISSNKHLTKTLLRDNSIPVPYGRLAFSEISTLLAAKEIGTPVAVKPHNGNQGKGVHLNLNKQRDIKAAFRDALRYSHSVIVEKYVTGKDYRVLVVGDKVCAVSERLPASIIGDGMHTINELIDIANQDTNRGENHEKPLTKIRLDTVAQRLLRRYQLSPRSVPKSGEIIKLRENGNLSTGGIAIDKTDIIHPENAQLAVRAAAVLGIDIAGIDFVTEDISVPIHDNGGVIVEVNTAPGIRMHLFPSEGTPRNVAKDIIDFIYPNDDVLDFPIVSVTGTNGKTTTTRLIAYGLSLHGRSVGMTTTSGTYINGKCIHKGDDTGPVSAKAVLSNKTVDAAVLETARGGIVRSGLGYELADVGIVTNIADDHLGVGDVKTLEDLAFVKALVVEAVKKDGYAVLNADDPMTPYILERVKRKVILFTKDYTKAKDAFGSGIIYVCPENGTIIIRELDAVIPIVNVKDIPITNKGTIICNIENSLAAVAALHALKVPAGMIAAALTGFVDNTGRFNLYELNDVSVLLDYGHNPSGYQAVIDSLPSYQAKRLVGVIGMPGDRLDETIIAVSEICAAAFDKIYIKEDKDLRGRKEGEVAGIMYSALIKKHFPKKEIIKTRHELDALQQAIGNAKSGDLIVVFYEKLEPLTAYINSLK